MKSFYKWITTFIDEKGMDMSEPLTDKNGEYVQAGMVLQAMVWAPPHEQAAIKDMIVKIDFLNGDVMDYFRHLAKAIDGKEIEQKMMDSMKF